MNTKFCERRAVFYLRGRRAQTGAGANTLGAQLGAVTRKAKELEARAVASFVDVGGSARDERRPGLQELLKRIRTTGDVDYVIVKNYSRLSRCPQLTATLAREFKKRRVRLITVDRIIENIPSTRLCAGWESFATTRLMSSQSLPGIRRYLRIKYKLSESQTAKFQAQLNDILASRPQGRAS